MLVKGATGIHYIYLCQVAYVLIGRSLYLGWMQTNKLNKKPRPEIQPSIKFIYDKINHSCLLYWYKPWEIERYILEVNTLMLHMLSWVSEWLSEGRGERDWVSVRRSVQKNDFKHYNFISMFHGKVENNLHLNHCDLVVPYQWLSARLQWLHC